VVNLPSSYKVMKGDANCGKRAVWGTRSLEIAPFVRAHTTAFHSNSTVSQIKQDTGGKSTTLTYPTCI